MNKKTSMWILGSIACVMLVAAPVSAQLNDPTVVKLVNPLGGTEENPQGTVDIPVILGQALTSALGIMGSAALLMFVVGGVMWLTSAGNAERVKKGTQTMVWSAIGVLIILSSYAILSLVLKGIGADGAPSGSANTNPAAPAGSTSTPATTPVVASGWCYLPDSKTCVQGGGSPCPSGTVYKTEAECKNSAK